MKSCSKDLLLTLSIVPMSSLPKEAKMSHAMHGKI